jgi:NAD(P)-dependent dehydrogenase (short-subunit alcohol dehydrogenase family)
MLEGKAAIVTGAARGIGFEISRVLARAGAMVTLVDLRADDVREAADQLAAEGYAALPVEADISQGSQVRSMVEAAARRWGRVDILVNNAGICPLTKVEDISEEEWDRVMGVNLKGAFLCSQAAIPLMRAQKAGKIISISSNAGQMGGLVPGLHYSASKAGILGLTKGLARILAPDIQVNAVAPGTTESEMTRGWSPERVEGVLKQIPLGRLGRPSDTAAAVLFLASDSASFITGHTLSVNGGLLMV